MHHRHDERSAAVGGIRATSLTQDMVRFDREAALRSAMSRQASHYAGVSVLSDWGCRGQAVSWLLRKTCQSRPYPRGKSMSARLVRSRSTMITANQPFGAWGKVFPDPAMTLAAVDRLVHHATIFEINVDSYRRRAALERKQKGVGRPQKHATIKDLDPLSLRDNQTQI